MAPRGGRTDFTSLMGSTGVNSPVDGKPSPPPPPVQSGPTGIPLTDLVANPRNPRQHNLNVDGLQSIAEVQLQPALVVTRGAYLKLWPDDEHALGAARFVVVNGCRRLLAARTYGRTTLEAVVKDEIAATRASLRTAAIRENVERENLDVIEEAQAVEDLVADFGSATKAAESLGKTGAWVSQRRALLKLDPELQERLRAGEIAIRVARNLAQVPREDQVARWRAQLERENQPREPRPEPGPRPADAPHIIKALSRFDPEPAILAQALRGYLTPGQLSELVNALGGD